MLGHGQPTVRVAVAQHTLQTQETVEENAMEKTIRLTAAQAVVRYLAAQRSDIDGAEVPLFAGCWGIFGHGNVAGIGRGAVPRPRNAADLPRP